MELFCLKNKKYTAGLLLLSLFLFLFFPNKTHAINLDWPQFHFGPERNGFNASETQISPSNVSSLELAWTAQVYPNGITGLQTSSPVVANGILYVGSGANAYRQLYAFNATTGTQIWSAPTGGSIESTPVIANGKVYITDDAFNVYAFDANTGVKIWNRQFSFSGSNYLPNSLLVVNGVVYIAQMLSSNFGGTLWALDANNGNTIWANSLPTLTSSPSFADINMNGIKTSIIYQCVNGFRDGYVNAFKANTGELLWSTHTRCRVSSPAIYNGIVYIGSDDGSLYALDAATGAIIWVSNTTYSSIDSTPAIANGVVYVGGQSGSVYAYSSTTGALLWSTPIGAISSSPAVANGVVYVNTISNFGLYALDSNNGNVLWSYATPLKNTSSPAVANGFIYMVGDRDDQVKGPLYAFHLSDNIKPTTLIIQTPQPNTNGWNNTDVTINLNATDNNGGSGVKEIHYSVNGGTDNIVSGNSTSFIVSTEGTNTINYWSVDNAGNIEQTNTYSLKIDKTNPIITINSPIDGLTYILNQPVVANWSAIDSLSGLDYATGTVASGQNINTSTVGPHSFTVSATDNAGNTATKTVNYYVHYNFGGFLAPVSNNGKVFKTGGTIPVKFQLTDFNGNYVTNAVVNLYVAKITNDIIGTDEATTSTSNADTGNQFRYDSENNQYIFNLSTSTSPLGEAGTYQIKASLDDGSFYTLTISLK